MSLGSPLVLALRNDFERGGRAFTIRNFLRRIICDRPFRWLVGFRLRGSEARALRLCGRALHVVACRNVGIQIPSSVEIGEALRLPHWGGIVVNSKARIGSHVTILHNVTLGSASLRDESGAPVIGDYSYLGPGCSVLGPVRIGERSVVAANALVTRDIPDGHLAIGNPARVIERGGLWKSLYR